MRERWSRFYARRGVVRVALGFTAGLFVSIIIIAGREYGGRPEEAGASDGLAVGLACRQAIAEFGEQDLAGIHHVFELVNDSSMAAVEIARIGKTCGCLELRLAKRVVAPGKSTALEVKGEIIPRTPGAITRFEEQLLVHWRFVGGEAAESPLVLDLVGTYVPPVYYLTTQVGIDAPQLAGEHFQTVLPVFLNRARGVDIQKLNCLGPLKFDAAVTSRRIVDDGAFERADIRVSGSFEEGELPRFGALEITTNNLAVPMIRMPITLRAKAGEQVSLIPRSVAFGIAASGETRRREVIVRGPAAGGWQFISARALDAGIRVDVAPQDIGAPTSPVKLLCTLDSGEWSGAVKSALQITFGKADSRRHYSVPISGFVKNDRPPMRAPVAHP